MLTTGHEQGGTTGRRPVVDVHTHIFCWGENPTDGFISGVTQRAWLTRLLLWMTKLRREPGENLSAKMRNMLFRELL